MATEQRVRYSVSGGIALIELCNPPANTYSYELMRELDTAILAARMDDDVHVLVLTGAGDKFFCAGADINLLQQMSASYKYCFCLHANETLNRLEQTPKLTIAALNGHTVGGGLEVALACDLRVSAGRGKIGLPEVALGVLPGTGGTQRLTRLLGRARALELMIRGTTFEMGEGQSMGLLTEVLAEGDFRQRVLDYARDFVPPAKASRAVGLIKRAVRTGAEVSFESGLALERELQQQLFQSDDAQEGLAAYAERRKPNFTGR